MAHDTDASTSTSNGTKSHILHLNNNLNKKCNVVIDSSISIMWQEKCYFDDLLKANMPSNATYRPHKPISSYVHETTMSVYALYEPNAIYNMTRNTDIQIHIIGICSWKICLWHCTCMSHCTTTVTHIWIPPYSRYNSKQKMEEQSAPHTPNIIVKYVQERNMPLKCHMYAT